MDAQTLAFAATLGALLAAFVVLWRRQRKSLERRAQELEKLVRQRTAELEASRERFKYLAAHDSLTGLPNQRSLWEEAWRMKARADRRRTAFALMVLDLDNFKAINDAWGHQVGDRLLVQMGVRLKALIREGDFLARYGGEEFVCLLPNVEKNDLQLMADRFCQAIAATPFQPIAHAEFIPMTASVGISILGGPDDEIPDLFRRADAAMYEAKKTKNAAAVWREDLVADSGTRSREPALAGCLKNE